MGTWRISVLNFFLNKNYALSIMLSDKAEIYAKLCDLTAVFCVLIQLYIIHYAVCTQ